MKQRNAKKQKAIKEWNDKNKVKNKTKWNHRKLVNYPKELREGCEIMLSFIQFILNNIQFFLNDMHFILNRTRDTRPFDIMPNINNNNNNSKLNNNNNKNNNNNNNTKKKKKNNGKLDRDETGMKEDEIDYSKTKFNQIDEVDNSDNDFMTMTRRKKRRIKPMEQSNEDNISLNLESDNDDNMTLSLESDNEYIPSKKKKTNSKKLNKSNSKKKKNSKKLNNSNSKKKKRN